MKRDQTVEHTSPLLTRRTVLAGAGTLGLPAFFPLVNAASEALALTHSQLDTSVSMTMAAIEGKFGAALNAAWSGAESASAMSVYKAFPLTVEFWCKLDPNPLTYNFTWTRNVLVANEPHESSDHWAICLDTAVGTGSPPTVSYGTLSAYLPGMTPESVKSPKVVADGRWHYVAMVIDGRSVALYVDGEQTTMAAVTKNPGGTVIPGKLTVGKANLAAGGTLDFNGVIDDLRVSKIVREIRGIPTAPMRADAHTIGGIGNIKGIMRTPWSCGRHALLAAVPCPLV